MLGFWKNNEVIPHDNEWHRNKENRENSTGIKIENPLKKLNDWLKTIAKENLYLVSGKWIVDWVEYFCNTPLDFWKKLFEWENEALALLNLVTKDEKWKNVIENFLKPIQNKIIDRKKIKKELFIETIDVAIDNYYNDCIIYLKGKINNAHLRGLFENIAYGENGKKNIKNFILTCCDNWNKINQLISNINNEEYYSEFNQAIESVNKALEQQRIEAQNNYWYEEEALKEIRLIPQGISELTWESESPEDSIEIFWDDLEDDWEEHWDDQDEMPADFEDMWEDLTIQAQLWEAIVYLKYYFNKNKEFHKKFIKFYRENKNNWPNTEDPNYAQEQKLLEYARNPNISRVLGKDGIKNIQFYRIYYKFLLEREKNNWNLPKQLQFQKKYLEDIFNRMDQRVINYNKKRKNREAPIRRLRHRERPRRVETDNTIKWDLNSLSPFDIIRWNRSIKKYIFGNNEWDGSNPDKPRLQKITLETLKEKWVYQNLFNWVLETQEFSMYKEFFNPDGSIKPGLLWTETKEWLVVQESDISQLETIKKDIESEILRKARRENFWNIINEIDEKRRGKTIDVSCRMSAMMCCIRAIKSFFDSKASNFQIEDVNENIHLTDNNPRLLSMEWTMNGKHIKLYYNLDVWELRFDRFMWYDATNSEYKIWKNNNIQESVIKNLPTIDKMENVARNTPIANLPTTMWRDFARTNTLFRSEHIRAKEFISDWGSTLNVNKRLVENFYEKNLLEQEIISCIYGNFYEWEDIFNGNHPLIIWANQPEQLKMIELISNSIEYYKNDANKLWQFRNCIAMLWDLLKNKDKVEKCNLLKSLFLDDRHNDQDSHSQTISTLKKENPWATLKDMNSVIQYPETIVHTQWNKGINFHTFFNLFATWSWNMRHIDVEVCDNIVNMISKEKEDPLKAYLSEYKGDSTNVFSKNYEEAVRAHIVPDYVSKNMDDELEWNLGHMDSPNNYA